MGHSCFRSHGYAVQKEYDAFGALRLRRRERAEQGDEKELGLRNTLVFLRPNSLRLANGNGGLQGNTLPIADTHGVARALELDDDRNRGSGCHVVWDANIYLP